LQIHYLLVVRSCKHKEIFNYNWYDQLKLSLVLFAAFLTGFTPKKNPVGYFGYYPVV